MPLTDAYTEKALQEFSLLDLQEEEEEEIEVIYVENLSGKEIVDFARYGELDIIEELVRSGLLHKLQGAVDERGNSALHVAAANGHIDGIRIITSHVSDVAYVNQMNHEGNTALHWACLNGHYEAAKCLLDAGADFTVLALKNSMGHEAFDEALQSNHEKLMGLLADRSSQTSEPNDSRPKNQQEQLGEGML